MRLRAALEQGLRTLLDHHVPSAALAAELLLMHVLGRDRGYLHSHPEDGLPREVADRYRQVIAERCTGKPTQYITGHQEFWGLDFEVTPDVLIPRPETEHTVEAVLDLVQRRGLQKDAPLRIVDVGTGSGCLALALASEFPRAAIFGVDISPPALAVALRNARRLGMFERVEFLESDLLAQLLNEASFGTFDFVVSNPPYVGRQEIDSVQREVREFEPCIAWGGDLDRGDEIYRRLFPQALQALRPGGYVAVEIGYSMREAVASFLGKEWTEVEVRPDLCGIPRVVSAQRRE